MIERRIRKIIFILFFIFGLNALAAKPNVAVLPQVYIDSEQIFLKDIVKTQNLSKELKQKIDSILIGDAPKEGEIRKFSSYAISEIIRYNLKNNLSEISLKIPAEIKISRRGAKLTPKSVEAKLVEWVKSTCTPCDVEVNSLRVQKADKLSPSMTWEISNTQIIPRGNFNISLDLYKNNNFIKKVFVQGNLRILKEVPIVKRSLQYGQRIQKEDVSFEKRDVTFERDSIPSEDEIYGSEIARNISANQIIWQRNLKRKMALTRGNPVQVTVQNKGWRIHLTGISQENGFIGDTVKVLNPTTKKIIVGVIKDEGVVEVR